MSFILSTWLGNLLNAFHALSITKILLFVKFFWHLSSNIFILFLKMWVLYLIFKNKKAMQIFYAWLVTRLTYVIR